MELLNHPDDAIRELSRMESLWPEWYQPYLTQGVVLQTTGRPEEARQQLETAIALGAREPTAYYYLLLAIKSLAPEDNGKAYKVVADGLTWSPADPNLQAQAGKLALAMNDHSRAKAHLEEAIKLKPEMAEAYISTGSLYLCSAAWLPLGLPASDPLWTDAAKPWTSKKVWNGEDVAADHR